MMSLDRALDLAKKKFCQPEAAQEQDDMEAEATYSEAFDEGIILTHYRSKGCSLLE